MDRDGRNRPKAGECRRRQDVPGIVIADGQQGGRGRGRSPRIHAFVWGGKVRPTPTLPYGRWKAPA